MLLRKGVKNANLEALRDPQICHFKVAPLPRTWVAPLGRSLTIVFILDLLDKKTVYASFSISFTRNI